MTLRDALAQSINVPAVKLLYLVGEANAIKLAKAMGISTLGDPDQYGLTLVLGGGEVTLLDMTDAYADFANGGTHYPAISVLRIEDSDGNIIEDNTQNPGTQVLAPYVAQEINDVLSDPVARAPLGENEYFEFPGHDVAVKTGTTNDYKDAWTIGYTPDIAIGIWAGNNDDSPMTHNVSGFIVGPAWNQIMSYALTKLPNDTFTRTNIDESQLKPVFRGIWQEPGSDGSIHDILYWVDKSNPLGPVPADPASDPQFERWDYPVQQWAAQNGFTHIAPGSIDTNPNPTPTQGTPNVYSPSGGSVIPQ
jgi:membrane peptidoglycan carboxypeptidase